MFSHANLPGNWKTNFLRNDDNKDELFLPVPKTRVCYLGHRRQVIIFTILDGVVSSRDDQNTVGLQPCSLEEADTRMPLHVKDPMNCGLKAVTIRTVGTDVVVLAVAHVQGLPNIEQLWIAFVTG